MRLLHGTFVPVQELLVVISILEEFLSIIVSLNVYWHLYDSLKRHSCIRFERYPVLFDSVNRGVKRFSVTYMQIKYVWQVI